MAALTRYLILLALVLPLLYLSSSAPVFAQAVKDRELRQLPHPPWLQSPVEVLAIRAQGREIEPERKFAAADDWLQGLAFTLKNVSDKPLAYVELGLRFSAPAGSAAPRAMYRLSYGRNITLSGAGTFPGSTPRAVLPGETAELVLSDEQLPALHSLLARAEIPASVETVEYNIELVAFEGEPDVTWRYGYLHRRDPADARRFNVTERYVLPKRVK